MRRCATEHQKFAYISVLAGPRLRATAYVAAHEEFIEDLIASDIEHTVIRANGFFYSYLDLLEFVRRGIAISFGDGTARSNPIHEADLASACMEAIEGQIGTSALVGRRRSADAAEIEMAFAAIGRKPRVLRVPDLVARRQLCRSSAWRPSARRDARIPRCDQPYRRPRASPR